MTKRGKVLRDTTLGPGLLMMEGQQYRFSLEGEWASEIPPRPGQVVDVQLDSAGKIESITVVPDAKLVQHESEATMAEKSRVPGSSLVNSLGLWNILAACLLAGAWFSLTAASVQVAFPARLEFTFWQILGFLNAAAVPLLLDGRVTADADAYHVLAIVALAGPFIHHLWKNKAARLGGLLPLLLMVLVGVIVRSNLQSALGASIDDAAKQTGTLKAVSLSPGAYLSFGASLHFAFASVRALVTGKAPQERRAESTQRKAA